MEKELKRQQHEVIFEISSVEARLDELIQPELMRRMAIKADKAAREAIFPQCHKKPFCIISYKYLLRFLSKPESNDFAGPFAPAAWLELTEEQRLEIKTKAKQFVEEHPYLEISIEDLKSNMWKHVHGTMTIEEMLIFYKRQGDEEAYEALSDCALFLGWTSMEHAGLL
eukprot:gene5293-5828_t